VDYDKAILKLREIEKFESEIRQTEIDKNPKKQLDAWKEYIEYELKKADPGMTHHIWLIYDSYVSFQ